MFERVAIVGVGLLGASLGLAMKARRLADEVMGVGREGSASLDIALERQAIDRAFTSLAEAMAAQPDLVVLCTPVRQFPGKAPFRTMQGRLKKGAVVTDVGSTKARTMTWAAEIFTGPDAGVFVGSHPMAGSEKRGPGAAKADLYDGGLCLLCAVPSPAATKIEALWQALGMRTLFLDPATHDRWVATVSHLPHAIAFALVNAASKHPEMLAAAAGGFLDTTRIASSDVEMWTDIFLTNRDAVIAAIDEFSAGLATLRAAIAAGDEPAIRAAVVQAKQSRDALLARRPQANERAG